MADLLTSQPDVTVSFPILKTDRTADGDLLVYGKCTDGTVDSDEQIVDPDWSAEALKTWLSTGANLRVQHNPHRDPAGVGLEVELNRDQDGAHWLKALVVEPVAKRLVEKGVLRAFSVGIMRPKILSHVKARGGVIKGGDLGEVSLVDRPANRNCTFALVKADKAGTAEWVGKMEGDRDVITKMLTPSPADVARVKAIGNGNLGSMPEPELGKIPQPARQSHFANPISNRLAAAFAEERVAEKRQVSTAERESLASHGDALPGGGYPIANVGDLKNAIQAIGRAKNPGKTRAHIKRRAAELGRSDLIPDTWKGDGEDISDLIEGLTQELVSRIQKGVMSIDEAREQAGFGPLEVVKNGMMNDGDDDDDDYDDDDDDRDDGKPRGKKPAAKGDTGSARPRNIGHQQQSSGSPRRQPTDFDDDDDEASDSGSGYGGNKRFKCSACGTRAQKGAAFCAGCGAEFTGKGVPTAGVQGSPAASPVPGHRQPDGDNGVAEPPTWAEGAGKKPRRTGQAIAGSGTGNGVAVGTGGASLKSSAPYTIIRAHDAFCPAYSFADVMTEYPSLTNVTDAIDVTELRSAAMKAVSEGDFDRGEALLQVAKAAAYLAGADRAIVTDAREGLHKGFQAMYPDVHLTPCQMSPDKAQRNYITAGHADPSPDGGGGAKDAPVPMPPGPASADQFRRSYIAAGHAANSPAAKMDVSRPGPAGTGFANAAAKESTETAIAQVHDHIRNLFPDVCPFGEHADTPLPVVKTTGQAELIPDGDAEPAPAPAAKTAATLVPAEKAGKPAKMPAGKPGDGKLGGRKMPPKPEGKRGGGKKPKTAKLNGTALQIQQAVKSLAETAERDISQLRQQLAEIQGKAAWQAEDGLRRDDALKAAADQLGAVAASLAMKSERPTNDAELGSLRAKLSEVQGMLLMSDTGGKDRQSKAVKTAARELAKATARLSEPRPYAPGWPELQQSADSRAMREAAEELAKAAGALQAARELPAGWGPATGSGELAALKERIADLQAQMMRDNAAQSNESLKAAIERLSHASEMRASRPETLGADSRDISGIRERLGELQGYIVNSQVHAGKSDESAAVAAMRDAAIADRFRGLEQALADLGRKMDGTPAGKAALSSEASLVEEKISRLKDQLSSVTSQLGERDNQAWFSAAEKMARTTGDLAALREKISDLQTQMMMAQLRPEPAPRVKKQKQGKDARAFREATAMLAKALGTAQRPETSAPPGADVSSLESKISDLQELVNQLGGQPDPAQAPDRGIFLTETGKAASGGAVPAERRSLVDEAAQRDREEKFKFLKSLAASGDPQVRNQAQAQISKMLMSQLPGGWMPE